jgi:hypothetical protein
VYQNPVVIGEYLGSITELIELVDVPNVYLLADKFEDRITTNALNMIFDFHRCNSRKLCRQGEVCMGNGCIRKPVAPRWPDINRFCLPKPSGQHERCPSSDEYSEFTDNTWVYWDTENGNPDELYAGADHITSHGLPQAKVNAVLDDGSNGPGGIKMFYCCSKQPKSRSWDRKKWAEWNVLYLQSCYLVNFD